MRSPKIVTPQEDPADKAARQAEQARAESSRISETQGILNADTLRRLRRFGKTAQQSVPITTAMASAGGGGGSLLSPGSGFSMGDFNIGGGGGFNSGVQLY